MSIDGKRMYRTLGVMVSSIILKKQTTQILLGHSFFIFQTSYFLSVTTLTTKNSISLELRTAFHQTNNKHVIFMIKVSDKHLHPKQ